MIGLGLVATAIVACGLSVVGIEADDVATTSPEGGRTDGGGDVTSPDPLVDPFEAGIDASPDNCKAACTNGTCDGGWCVIGCDGGAECTNGVTCPPGVPCDVRCTGADACKSGVDCADATACNVLCAGEASCSNDTIRCKGSACQVTCSAKNACITGIACDAGTCVLRCLGDGSCKNQTVACNADRCTVECGVTGKDGSEACTAGVQCNATTSCDVRCLADNSCKNGPVTAVAGETANIKCAGSSSCVANVFASAADSGVQCTKAGACAGGVRCDGGRCAAHCEDVDVRLCCDAGTCIPSEGNGCHVTQKCP